MSEREWYIHQNNEQLGPFDLEAFHYKMNQLGNAPSTLIFRTGWTQWRPYSECRQEIQPTPPPPAAPSPLKQPKKGDAHQSEDTALRFKHLTQETSKLEPIRQQRSTRSSVQGQVIVHNNDNLIFAQSVNISAEGLFIKTDKPIFNIGEILKITCRVKELGAPFNAEAQVVRRSNQKTEPSGYGLFFTSLTSDISKRIHALIETQKQAS